MKKKLQLTSWKYRDHERLPQATMWLTLNSLPRRQGQILRKVQSPKTEL